MSVWGKDADRLQAGRWTYILYNPEKPDTCDLDKDRLAKEFGADRHGHPVMVPREVSNGWFQEQMAASAPPAAAPPRPDITEQLSKLADLRDRGVLTEAEFAAEKAKLLAAS
jgi:hypothetical protein